MASKIKLSNANGKIVTIENNDSNMSDVTLNGASITKKVDTLANMRAMNELPETVWCSGYHTKNDGAFGSHFFRLKGLKTTEDDNGGTVIIATIGGVDYVYELQYDGAVNAKWFGAVPNDNTAGISNFLALKGAVENSIEIIIDDTFYMDQSTNVIAFDTNTRISGGKLIFQNATGGYCFKVYNVDFIELLDVHFENEVDDINTPVVLFGWNDNTTGKVSNFNVDGCKFINSIRLFIGGNATTVDPSSNDIGFDTFTLNNNECIRNKRGFVLIANSPAQSVRVTNNKVQDFAGTWFNYGIENEHSFPSEIEAAQRNLLVENNVVFNTIADMPQIAGSTYFTFVLFEGTEINYINNSISNIITTTVIATYDSYIGAVYHNAIGNTIKNVLCLAELKTHNELIKSKSSSNLNIQNNHYIVEKSKLDEYVGITPKIGSVLLHAHTSNGQLVNIRNNVFDVYALELNASSQTLEKIYFKNNTLNCEHIAGLVFRMNSDLHAAGTDLICDVSDNNFNIGSIGEDLLYSSGHIRFFGHLGTAGGTFKYLGFNNNNIVINSLVGANPAIYYNVYSAMPECELIEACDNNVVVVDDSGTFINGYRAWNEVETSTSGNILIKNNKSIAKSSTYSCGVINIKTDSNLEFKEHYYGKQGLTDQLSLSLPSTGQRVFTYKLLWSQGGETYSQVGKFYLTPTTISYYDTANVFKTITSPTASTPITIFKQTDNILDKVVGSANGNIDIDNTGNDALRINHSNPNISTSVPYDFIVSYTVRGS